MTSGLLIVGAGGHGKVVADTALQQGRWQKLAFLDDAPNRTEGTLGLSILGDTNAAANLVSAYPDLVVAIGNPVTRLELMKHFQDQGFNLPVIAHPSAVISPYAVVQFGSVLFAQSAVNAGAKLGAGCIINTCASVDHDCVLDDGVHVGPGAHLAGGVHIGRATWIGIGACVRENIVIGDHVTVGAGAAVVSYVQDNQTVAGVPAAAITRSKT